MKSSVGTAQRNAALGQIIARSVENQIKLEALEEVLVKTSPMIQALYLGQIALTKQKAVKLNPALAPTPKKR